MTALKFIITIFFFILCSPNTYSQNESPAKDFLTRIEGKLKEFVFSTDISNSQLYTSKRKIKIEGKSESSKTYLKLKVKYFRSGLKKEIIKLYKINPNGSKQLHTEIIRINGNFFYVKNIEFSNENKILYKELYIDNNSYQKITFNEANTKTSSRTYFLPYSNK